MTEAIFAVSILLQHGLLRRVTPRNDEFAPPVIAREWNDRSNLSFTERLMAKQPCIYIMSNFTDTVLYTGVTSNLPGRIQQHKSSAVKGFTKPYNCTKLVYFELFGDMENAITREKQLKGGSRRRKEELINAFNPGWRDLSDELG